MLYFITDETGEHVMTAPLNTLVWIFDLTQETLERIKRETRNLNDICILHFNQHPACGKWRQLQVRRLPLEIPAREAP